MLWVTTVLALIILLTRIKLCTPVTGLMNTNIPMEKGGSIVYVPFWVVALLSAMILTAGYLIYRFLTEGKSF
jgi:hypothetical protein